jgi:hypothetical protein
MRSQSTKFDPMRMFRCTPRTHGKGHEADVQQHVTASAGSHITSKVTVSAFLRAFRNTSKLRGLLGSLGRQPATTTHLIHRRQTGTGSSCAAIVP